MTPRGRSKKLNYSSKLYMGNLGEYNKFHIKFCQNWFSDSDVEIENRLSPLLWLLANLLACTIIQARIRKFLVLLQCGQCI